MSCIELSMMVMCVNYIPNLRVDAPPFPLLHCFIEGSHSDQKLGRPRANLKRC